MNSNSTFTPNIELDSKSFSLNLVEFRKFLIDNNVTVSIVGFAVGYYLRDLIDSFYNNIMFCDDNLDFINNYYLCLFNVKIYLGRFIISLLKFVISTLLVFYIARVLNDFVN